VRIAFARLDAPQREEDPRAGEAEDPVGGEERQGDA
jgi:hypothetical protein